MHIGMPGFGERFLEVVLVFAGEVAFCDKGENAWLRYQSALGVGEMAPFRSEIFVGVVSGGIGVGKVS